MRDFSKMTDSEWLAFVAKAVRKEELDNHVETEVRQAMVNEYVRRYPEQKVPLTDNVDNDFVELFIA